MSDAKISVVDYEAIPGQAGNMRGKGEELNRELKKIYDNVTNMHNCWYGKRYNELATSFNNIIAQLNDILTLVVTEIPSTLETVANNYAQVDRGSNVTSVNRTDINKITEIARPNDVGMRFMTSDVQTVKDQVKTGFNNARSQMDAIESILGTVTWDSEAATAFRDKFKTLKNNIVTSFQNLDQEFANKMQATIEDMAQAESANTVK